MTTPYTIIEDCSPYYIRFTHPGIDKIIELCKKEIENVEFTNLFTQHIFSENIGQQILDLTPFSSVLDVNTNAICLFVTNPGRSNVAHKDGTAQRAGVNYAIEILDDKCTTSWYDDPTMVEELIPYKVEGSRKGQKHSGGLRIAKNFDKTQHQPVKSFVMKPQECVLVNTDIFHNFDNSKSLNRRIILLLRFNKASTVSFEDARRALFRF